ncbi:MAG: type II toxin-antitoxin system RelE/ParE family toxin [Campylobacterota bacterium]|nr:type II toxin-antitoxin system RelE/ParE family toxin [Campylobacterota bacterium]
MNFKIETIPRFEKDVKKLKKKFPKIKNDLVDLMGMLSLDPEIGIHLGENIFKVRFPNSSIPTGKSGGFRVITYYKADDILYLVTIYSKTEQDNVLTEKLKDIVLKEIVR